ncbi:MAG: TonB-dependent receptor [Pseudomonadales bacterium]|nr:TonB-dependent receptor [Pseudomonadales bacterium]MCP5186016.1 TonB-dependent receptor [Pseudomonadales bacterium]
MTCNFSSSRQCLTVVGGLLVMAVSLLVTGSSAVAAEQADNRVIEEILVTSTKRAQADVAQDVPVTSTVVSAAMIQENNWVDLVDVARMVPGADFRQTATFPGIQRFWMRAVGVSFSVPNFDPAIGVYQDGVFVAQNIASILDTFDMESVEILRGPQGTLFGRNTSVGAVVTRSRRPGDEFILRGEATFGSFDRKDFSVSMEGPLIEDKLAAKLAVLSRDRDGWADDLVSGQKKGAYESTLARATLVFTPVETLDVTLIGEFFERGGDGAVSMPLGLTDSGRSGHPLLPGVTREWDETWGVGSASEPWTTFSDHEVEKFVLEANWDVGHGILTAVTGYIDVDAFSGADFDGLPPGGLAVITRLYIDQEQFSQELRYASNFSEKFDFTAGLYYFTQDLFYGEQRHANTFVSATNPFGLRPPGADELKHDSYAAFIEGRIHLSDDMTLTLGGRYTSEKKDVKIGLVNSGSCSASMVPPFETSTTFFCLGGAAPGGWDIVDDETWNSFSPRISVDYRLNDDVLLFAGWTRGQRSGGFSFRASPTELTVAANDPTFRPAYYDEEQVDSIEIGMKSDLLDRRLRLNVTAYYQFWDGIQRNLQAGGPSDAVQRTANVKESHVYGLETEVSWIAATDLLASGDMLRLDGSLALAKSGYDSDYFESGRDLSDDPFGAPHNTAYGAIVYEHPVGGNGASLAWRATYQWKEAYWQEGIRQSTAINHYNANNRLDASVQFNSADGNWFIKAFGRNLTYDKTYQARVVFASTFGLGNPDDPRTFGVTFGFEH